MAENVCPLMIQPQAEILNDPQQIQDAIQTEEPMLMEDLSPVQEVVSEVVEHQTTTSQKRKRSSSGEVSPLSNPSVWMPCLQKGGLN